VRAVSWIGNAAIGGLVPDRPAGKTSLAQANDAVPVGRGTDDDRADAGHVAPPPLSPMPTQPDKASPDGQRLPEDRLGFRWAARVGNARRRYQQIADLPRSGSVDRLCAMIR
jgi:hypothetical protein